MNSSVLTHAGHNYNRKVCSVGQVEARQARQGVSGMHPVLILAAELRLVTQGAVSSDTEAHARL